MPINPGESTHPPNHSYRIPHSPPSPASNPSHTHEKEVDRARQLASRARGHRIYRRSTQTTIDDMALLVAVAVLLVASWSAGVARGDFAQDRAMCADKLMGLATCLTFVQEKATARAPTPDCCAGLKQVLAGSKLCMCVLVKDRDEPQLGIKFNVTRAMDLPALCSQQAIFSDCPKMLGMSPDAPEAEIFKEYGRTHEGKNATIPAAATGAGATGKSTSAAPTTAGAGRQPCTVFLYLVLALLASVAVLLA